MRSTAAPLPSDTGTICNGNALFSEPTRGLSELLNCEVKAQGMVDENVYLAWVSVGLEPGPTPQPEQGPRPGPELELRPEPQPELELELELEPEPELEPELAMPSKRGPQGPPKSGLVSMDFTAKWACLRPRPKPLSALMGHTGQKSHGHPSKARPIGSRPRGWPKKDASVVKKTLSRGHARLPKNTVAATATHADAAEALGGEGCSRGNGAVVVVGDAMLPAKGWGRLPGCGGVKKPRKVTGKPLGWPRKNALIAGDQAVTTQEVVAYEELKNKLEHFQLRVRHAVSLVKPQLNNETAVSALGALQELEQLATLDLSSPFHVQEQ